MKIGDVVLFTKQESVLSNTYQYGMVDEVERSRDNRIRRVKVRYQNSSENCRRFVDGLRHDQFVVWLLFFA